MPTLQDITRELLADLHTDQAGLARLVGLTEQAISAWARGVTKRMDAEAAFALQKKTGWSAEYLMLGTGPKKISAVRQQAAELALEQKIAAGELLDLRDMASSERARFRRIVDALAEPAADSDQQGHG